jgi:hypothetical protein
MLNKKDEGVDHHFITVGDALDPTPSISTQEQDHDDRWGTVWAEATLLLPSKNLPVATAVVSLDEETTDHHATTSTITSETPPPQRRHHDAAPPPLPSCQSGADLIFGSVLVLVAVSCAYVIELCAVIFYMLAAAFHRTSLHYKDLGCLNYIVYAIFQLVVAILRLVDALFLFVSVCVTELVGLIAYTLIVCFSGTHWARQWFLYIRHISHLTRWAFRGFHKDWALQRSMPWSRHVDQQDDHNDRPTHQYDNDNHSVKTRDPVPRVVIVDTV